MDDVKQSALALAEMGVITVPCKLKIPQVPYSEWRNMPDHAAMEACVNAWESIGDICEDAAVLCGTLICVDVDVKNDTFDDEITTGLFRLIHEDEFFQSLSDTYVERTASGGWHFWYYTPFQPKTESWAMVPDPKLPNKYKPVIEVRGENSLCRCFPSSGIKLDGNIRHITGAKILTEDEYLALKYACVSLSLKPPEVITKVSELAKANTHTEAEGRRPGDHYNDDVDPTAIAQLFEDCGWIIKKHRDQFLLRRPGAATKGYDGDVHIKRRSVIIYSSSVTEFGGTDPHSFFSTYAILKHSGDFAEAARALYNEGWGDRKEAGAKITYEGDADFLPEVILATRITMDTKVEDADSSLIFHHPETGEAYQTGGHGQMFVASGPPKSRKTTAVTSIAASFIEAGKVVAGWSFTPRKKGKLLWYDTEQPAKYAKRTYHNILRQTSWWAKQQHPPCFEFYTMRKLSPAQRITEMKKILAANPDTEALVIDGIKDMAVDYVHDNKEADRLISMLMEISEQNGGVAIFVVIHVNKTDNQIRGHLGTELKNKADTVMLVTRDEKTEISSVSFPATRDRQPPAYDFEVDQYNVPFFSQHTQAAPGPYKPNPIDITTSRRANEEDLPF